MRRSSLKSINKPIWLKGDDFTHIVYYSTLTKRDDLLYFDLYRDPPYSLLYYKIKTDFGRNGSLSIPLSILEGRGIDVNQLHVLSEYEVYFIPFGVASIQEINGVKTVVIEKKQVAALFYTDFQRIFNMFPDIDEIQNVLIHFRTNKAKVNLKSIGSLLSEEQSFTDIVNALIEAKYNSEFYDEFFNSLTMGSEDGFVSDDMLETDDGEEEIDVDF